MWRGVWTHRDYEEAILAFVRLRPGVLAVDIIANVTQRAQGARAFSSAPIPTVLARMVCDGKIERQQALTGAIYQLPE